MKKSVFHYISALAATAAMLTAMSCSDETALPAPTASGYDGLCHLTLTVPSPTMQTASRAGTYNDYGANMTPDYTNNVSRIESFYLLAFNLDNRDNDYKARLEPKSNPLGNDYQEYHAALVPGKYHIYAAANIDEISKLDSDGKLGTLTEEQLNGIVLRYSSEALPTATDTKGLPMLSILQEEKNKSALEAYKGTETLHIDMAFLCAKVRYTLLFDNTGFSNTAFGDKAITFTSVRAERVDDAVKIVGRDICKVFKTEYNDVKHTPFDVDASLLPQGRHCEYPADLTKFELHPLWDKDGKGDTNIDLTLTPLGGEPSGGKRAYQGTLYLPENMDADAPTRLIFDAVTDDGKTLQYIVNLPPTEKVTGSIDDNGEAKGGPKKDTDEDLHKGGFGAHVEGTLQRGHFYDLVGKVTSIGGRLDMTARVGDWTLQTLAWELHGPYFLHVDKTEIEVHAGKETLIEFDTDAGELTFESDIYPREGVDEKKEGATVRDLLICKTVEIDGRKYISVSVNPEIPAENKTLENRYFDIHAANLTKRIKATIVSLNPYLNVSPEEIEINVREYIASGEYGADIPITFDTNLDNVTITGFEDWGSSITLDGEKSYPNASVGTNTLKLTGMNGGDFWKTERTLTLTYTATNGNVTEERTVKIHIVPNRLNYLIHFRAPDGWTAPHIYVYQCLQLPADHDTYPSKPVGYSTINEKENHEFFFSALEYSFTGKVAFKGWSKTDSHNNPSAPGSYGPENQGFFIFDNNPASWSLENEKSGWHYNFDMDFCKAHREQQTCNDCKTAHKIGWPGIQMLEEAGDSKWWSFQLTDVATPGKALIMFADGHEGSATNRYPGHAEVGIPLFDFPNREGWFDLANGATQFSATKPQERTYRLYWPQSIGNYNYIYWGNSTLSVDYWSYFNAKERTGVYKNHNYYDLTIPETNGTFKVLFKSTSNGDDKYGSSDIAIDVDKFTDDGDGIYCCTWSQSGIQSGKPQPLIDPQLQDGYYRIYWRKAAPDNPAINLDGIYTWNCNNTALNQQHFHASGTVGEYNYFDFDPKNSGFTINVIIKESSDSSNWANNTQDIPLTNNNFSNRRCTITITGSPKYNFTPTQGKPSNLN